MPHPYETTPTQRRDEESAPQHPLTDGDESHKQQQRTTSNEYVLNFAFYSFIGFVLFQAVFAIIANSESMLADSEAMSVDALTYLFNLVAERIKNADYTEKELALPIERRQYQRELRRLYLELIPPLISVVTLMVVTVITTREALATLNADAAGEEQDDVSVPLMLLFSAANLLLDVVNVTCFARADSTFGLDIVRREKNAISETMRSETSDVALHVVNEHSLLLAPSSSREESELTELLSSTEGSPRSRNKLAQEKLDLVNLNMCSAWTHICADTMRSVAVLVAAFIATVVSSVDGTTADSVAAIVVSLIIFISLLPLFQGLVITGLQIYALHCNPPLC